jgi:LemA protein
MNKIFSISILATSLLLGGCGYNSFQTTDEASIAAWSEVINQYQRRSDLIPNLVEVVKGYVGHEKDTLVGVIEARAKASSIQLTPQALKDPQALKNFNQSQGELTQALSRLMVVSERYPDLKANQQFRDLQSQIEGTENRITVARNRYIKSVQDYNLLVRKFPTNLTAMLFSYETKAQFSVENEKAISTVPKVTFK